VLKAAVEASLRNRGAVIALACLALGYGVITVRSARLEVLPDLSPPRIHIQTEAPGFPPEEVESLVTGPIEMALRGTAGLESTSSRSIQGLSAITASFGDGTEILTARQHVSEALARIAKDLPAGLESPILAPPASSLALGIGLTSEKRSLMDIRTLADWSIRPRLLAVPGVASVVELGGDVRQIQVQIRPETLARHGLAASQVVEAARSVTGVMGTGFVETANQRIPISLDGSSITAESLGESLAAPGIRLKDVARVADEPEPKVGDAAIDGKPGVLLLVRGQQGEDVRRLTRSLEAALEDLRPLLDREGIRIHSDVPRSAGSVEAATWSVAISLLAGAILMAAAIAVLFLNARTIFIALLAIVLSLLMGVAFLCASGATLNVLTLGGLVLALGEVVDDAINGAENVFRRLRENQQGGAPRSKREVVLRAALEIRSAVVPATLVSALVFLPVIALPGGLGRLCTPIGIAYLFTALASLLVALTVTPVVCLALAGTPVADKPAYLPRLRSAYQRALGAVALRPGSVILAAVVVLALAASTVAVLRTQLLPRFEEGYLVVRMSMAPGTSVAESMRLGGKASQELLAHPSVRSVSLQVGRTELDEDAMGTESSKLILALKPLDSQQVAEVTIRDVRGILAGIPGARFSVGSLLGERLEEAAPSARGDVALLIHGDDLDVIEATADDVESVLASIPGSTGVRSRRSREPRLMVRVEKEKLVSRGFQSVEVMEAIRTSFQGVRAARVHDKDRAFDVVVILDEKEREDPESVGSLLIRNAAGAWMPLREVADIFLSTGRHRVLHNGSRRYEEVSCDVEDRDLDSFVREMRSKIASEVKIPPDVQLVIARHAEGHSLARKVLPHLALAVTAILFLLAGAIQKARSLSLVLTTLPFALAGGVVAIALTGGWLSLGSLAGLVALLGITLRGSLATLSRFDHLVSVEERPWNLETALRGASERFLPILMTACVTAAGILPFALRSHEPGMEVVGPMATVILGGLVTSTALNLLVLPALALRPSRLGQHAG
jgi:CzcA family heavy metal efflux pump